MSTSQGELLSTCQLNVVNSAKALTRALSAKRQKFWLARLTSDVKALEGEEATQRKLARIRRKMETTFVVETSIATGAEVIPIRGRK